MLGLFVLMTLILIHKRAILEKDLLEEKGKINPDSSNLLSQFDGKLHNLQKTLEVLLLLDTFSPLLVCHYEQF